MGEECASVGASRVKSIHGSFLSLYGSALQRGSFVLNPYTGVFHPYVGVLRSMRCNPGAKFTPFALPTIPADT